MSLTLRFIFQFLRVCAALMIIAFFIWRINLAHEVNAKLAAIRAAGFPTSGTEENNYYPAVSDNQNAALAMEKAFLLLTNYDNTRSRQIDSITYIPRQGTLTSTQMELVSGYVTMNSNALALAKEAIRLPRSRYPIDLSWGVNTLLPHLQYLKALSRVAEFQALLDTNETATDVSTVIGMAHTLDNEPDLIPKLVRIAMMNMAASILEHSLNNGGELNKNDLVRLSPLFSDSNETNQIVDGLIGERAMMIPYFRMSKAEVKKYSAAADQNSPEPGGPPLPGPQPLFSLMTGFFERDLRFYLEAMDTNIALAAIYPKNVPLMNGIQDQFSQTARRNYYIFSSMLLPAIANTLVKEANEVARIRTAQTAIAIERFRLEQGTLPDNLNELVPKYLSAVPLDPFDDKPIRYRRLAKGYVVYSIGSDGEDNGGREKPAKAKLSDQTHYDITFTVER